MTRNEYFILTAIFCGCLLILCCGRGEQTASQGQELVILCGSSFVPPVDEVISQFKAETGVEIVTTSAGSEDFLPLVKAGRKGDILITHDPYLDYVKDVNAYLGNAVVGFVAPVLAVAKGNPKKIYRIEDLAQDDLRVGLTDPQYSTCGDMVFSLFEKRAQGCDPGKCWEPVDEGS